MENNKKNVTKEELAEMVKTDNPQMLTALDSRIEKMTYSFVENVINGLQKKQKAAVTPPSIEDCMRMLDNAYHNAVSVSTFLSEIQMSLVLYDMEYPMRDNNWTTSVIMEHSQIQTILCPIHFLLKYCAEEAMGYFPMEYCVPTKFCDMMENRAPKSIRSCFGDLPFLMDVEPTYDSFVSDTKVATADAFWYLSGVLWYIDRTRKELKSETIAWLAPMVVMIDDIMSAVKKRIDDFDEDALLNF